MIGKFIVIEGIDGSGKATQTELLKNRLEKSGRKILVGDFSAETIHRRIWDKLHNFPRPP